MKIIEREKNMSHDTNYNFFIASDDYEILRFGGESVREESKEIEVMVRYFGDSGLTEELLKENSKKYNLEKMLDLVKKYFNREYGYYGNEIELSNNYQHSVNSYIFLDDERTQFVHMDELFESSIISFFLIMFKWTKELDNIDIYGDCFRYLLYILNDVCILGIIPDFDSNEELFKIINGDAQIMTLAYACYWTVVVFNLAHEVAHAYLASINKKFTKKKKEEFVADAIAYDIVLQIIVDQQKIPNQNRNLEDYTYLAPIMYMRFFDLFHYTDRVLYNKRIVNDTHPLPEERISHLFAIANDEKYMFETTDGNKLYDGFLDVYDEYRTQLLLKKERGKLDKIIRTDKREWRNVKDEQNRSKTVRL